MTDIWIVTCGEYSSYAVIAAFSTVEAADVFAATSNANREYHDSRYEVERLDFDPPPPAFVPREQREIIEFESNYIPPLSVEERRAKIEQETKELMDSLVLEDL